MANEKEIEAVMAAIRQSMVDLKVEFSGFSINVLDPHDSTAPIRLHYSYMTEGAMRWKEEKSSADSAVLQIWQQGKVAYRPNIRKNDPYEERINIDSYFKFPVRTIIGIPFSHGTLAFNSEKPDAFAAVDIAFMEELAGVLSEGFMRQDDLKALTAKDDQLLQAQKMEIVGELTVGVAYNFNNMLQAIIGNLLLAIEESPPPIQTLLQAADGAAQRAADVVRQLMVFSHQGNEASKEPVELTHVVYNVLEICRKTFDRSIEIIDAMPDNLAPVLGHAASLEQIFLNLCLNARDAVKDQKNQIPFIRIEARQEEITAFNDRQHPTHQKSGHYNCILVSDNGCGMDEETRERIFQPFFTTKEIGQGTGLGLSTVFGITSDHEGWIDCQSTPGLGTTFMIYLPLAPGTTLTPAAVEGHGLSHGSETILVVDDEEVVRKGIVGALEYFGYKTMAAVDGQQALEIFTERTDEIDLVLLDLSMPGIPGSEVLQQMRRLAPLSKVVIFSGYAADDQITEQANAVVGKPVSMTALTRTMRGVLDG
jgi:two-component system cell cycle sensor histidine kinase/response regulator CckA